MRRDPSYLLDMLSSARDAVEFAAELTFHEFEQSLLHRNAILKSIEIIGEAASRLSDETKETHPEIEWRKMLACVTISSTAISASITPESGRSFNWNQSSHRKQSDNSYPACQENI